MSLSNTNLTTLVGVPIDSSGYPNGLERMPRALREAGIGQRINLRDDGDLPVAIYNPRLDPNGKYATQIVARLAEMLST